VRACVRVHVVPLNTVGSLQIQVPSAQDCVPFGPQGKHGAVKHSVHCCCGKDEKQPRYPHMIDHSAVAVAQERIQKNSIEWRALIVQTNQPR
jgi:hypothetical protein